MADVDQVAQTFAQHYYQVFSANRAGLAALYVLDKFYSWHIHYLLVIATAVDAHF